MNANQPAVCPPFVLTIERDWVMSLDMRPVMRRNAPDEFPVDRLAGLRGKLDIRFQAANQLVEQGVPSRELRGFLRRWHSMWPFFGWFAPAGHPIHAVVAACCADSLEVVYWPASGRVQWRISEADHRRFRESLLHGILHIADLVDAEDDDWQEQVEGIDESIERFITLA